MSRAILAAAASLLLAASAVPAPAFAGTDYVYDSAGRLIRVTYSNGVTIEYRYDAAGNRQQVVTSSVPNSPPSAVNDSASVAVSQSIDIQVRSNDSDPNGNTLTVTNVSTPTGGGSVSIMGGGTHVRYTAPAAAGTKTFTYTISDGRGGSDTATVTVTVTGVSNQSPTAVDDWANSLQGASDAIWVLGNDTDPENNTLTVTGVGTPTGGSASIASGGGYVIYQAPAQPGTYSFTYTISDGAGGTSSATVYVVVEELGGGCVPQPGHLCEADPPA